VCCSATPKPQSPAPLPQPFHPPSLREVRNETLPCREAVWGAAVLHLSVGGNATNSGDRAYIASEARPCSPVKPFGCGWPGCPPAGYAAPGHRLVALLRWAAGRSRPRARPAAGRGAGAACGCPARWHRGRSAAAGWGVPAENRNALQLERLIFFFF